jgi:glycosyltransferase involved in cell wall biosynthesis
LYFYNSLRFVFTICKLSFGLMTGNAPGLPSAARTPPGTPLVVVGPLLASRFAERRRYCVAAINSYVDHVLAVSARVAQMAVQYGIQPTKVRTEYIGTRFSTAIDSDGARQGRPIQATRRSGNTIRILYPGYMRRDKGFYFYLAALEKAPPEIASRLELIFATKISDPLAYARIRNMAHRFESVTYYNGYTHAQLPQILANVDLAVVPVLWEDNLPQVAIECVASGVAILTSDRGGARELLDSPELVFKAGSRIDFYSQLEGILQNPGLLRSALARRRPLLSPEQHYERLRSSVYQSSPAGSANPEPTRYLLTGTTSL